MRMLNAVDYGVPQNRLRVIAVGHRGGFEFPGADSRRVTAGEAVGGTARMIGRDPKFLTPGMDKYSRGHNILTRSRDSGSSLA